MTSPLAPTDEGAVAERLRERILVNFAPYDKLTHNLKLCLLFRGAKRRGNPFSSGIMCIPLAVHRGCGLPRPVTSVTGLGMTEVFYTLPFLLTNGSFCTLATPQSATPPAPLKWAPRGERHSDWGGALRGAAHRCCARLKPLQRSAAPFRVAKRRRGSE